MAYCSCLCGTATHELGTPQQQLVLGCGPGLRHHAMDHKISTGFFPGKCYAHWGTNCTASVSLSTGITSWDQPCLSLSLSLAFLCTNSILVRRSPTSLGVWCQSSAHVLRISALDMGIPNRTPGAATNMLECGGAAFRPWKSRSATQNRSISPIPSARGCVVHGCYKLAYCIWDTKWVQTFACNHSLCCYTS
jgi:hypothetical protein